jgi:hypothetical protein
MNIHTIVNEINQNNLTRSECEKKYPDFFTGYPTLCKSIFEENFDFDTLLYMLKKKDNVDDNTTTQHDASVDVGTLLVDKYVKPNL